MGRCSYLVCRYRTVRRPAAAQATDPPCPPGEAPSASIRGFDIEDGGGELTATHTIALEAAPQRRHDPARDVHRARGRRIGVTRAIQPSASTRLGRFP